MDAALVDTGTTKGARSAVMGISKRSYAYVTKDVVLQKEPEVLLWSCHLQEVPYDKRCGSYSYNPLTHGCCSGRYRYYKRSQNQRWFKQLQPIDPWMLLGRYKYYKRSQKCCVRYQRCGSYSYNPLTHGCCSSRYKYYKRSQKCCTKESHLRALPSAVMVVSSPRGPPASLPKMWFKQLQPIDSWMLLW